MGAVRRTQFHDHLFGVDKDDHHPEDHAARHATGGDDELTPEDIGAAPEDHSHTGLVDAHYVHNQLTPEATWVIEHNLGKKPSVTVVDSGGSEVMGDVSYFDLNTLHVVFASPFGGRAFLN